MNVLVIAPMPSHPATQGNRQRALDIGRAFQRHGATITYLYWTAEGLAGDVAKKMGLAWEEVSLVQPHGFKERRSHEPFYGIDDWYHEAIGERVKELCKTRHFDVCIVNYVWLSAALECLPPDCVRVIDTHDVFGGRAEQFYKIGLKPQWYYTSPSEETIGLDRADFAIAIQDEEAELLKTRTRAVVETVGFLARPIALGPRPPGDEDHIHVGYIGSSNPFNVASVLEFCAALERRPLPEKVRLLAAGPICSVLRSIPGQPFELLGLVDELASFYEQIDISINPMTGGTGLKIKTIEALAFGVSVVGTPDAFAGIPTEQPEHRCADADAVVAAIAASCASPETLAASRRSSQTVFQSYLRTQRRNFETLYAEIRALAADRKAKVAAGMSPLAVLGRPPSPVRKPAVVVPKPAPAMSKSAAPATPRI